MTTCNENGRRNDETAILLTVYDIFWASHAMIPPTKCLGHFTHLQNCYYFQTKSTETKTLSYKILLICKLSLPKSHSHNSGFKIAAIFYANEAGNVDAILISRPCDKKGYELYILCGGHSDPENSQRITFTRRGELPKWDPFGGNYTKGGLRNTCCMGLTVSIVVSYTGTRYIIMTLLLSSYSMVHSFLRWSMLINPFNRHWLK